jgi:modification methylase
MAPDLAATLIRNYTQSGEVVFDPLAGVGTTLVEAIHAGRTAMAWSTNGGGWPWHGQTPTW